MSWKILEKYSIFANKDESECCRRKVVWINKENNKVWIRLRLEDNVKHIYYELTLAM
jgi:hypothetical protein